MSHTFTCLFAQAACFSNYSRMEEVARLYGDAIDWNSDRIERAMLLAIENENAKLVRALLGYGVGGDVRASCDSDEISAMVATPQTYWTRATILRKMREAVLKDDVDALDGIYALPRADAALLNARQAGGATLMIDAAVSGSARAFAWLMRRGARWQERDERGSSALSYAIKHGHKDIVEKIRASVARAYGPCEDGWDELEFYGVVFKKPHAINTLKSGELEKTWRGMTLMHAAVLGDNLDALHALFVQGADLEGRGGIGLTPLELAGLCGHGEAAQKLLQYLRARGRADARRAGEAGAVVAPAVEAQ